VSQQPKLTNVQSASVPQAIQAADNTTAPLLLVGVGIGAGGLGDGVADDPCDELTVSGSGVDGAECWEGLPTSVLAQAATDMKPTKA